MRGQGAGGQGGQGERNFTNAQCPMPNAQCPMPNAQCPMPHAQCPIPHSLFMPLLMPLPGVNENIFQR
ncbi:MAG: hypothetical protein KME31_09300 [Tolypothrix carrinoi HA7290-LM1]|nr:hypothetical protein [Tolypothrix carrinoi HA7290-LM1]